MNHVHFAMCEQISDGWAIVAPKKYFLYILTPHENISLLARGKLEQCSDVHLLYLIHLHYHCWG